MAPFTRWTGDQLANAYQLGHRKKVEYSIRRGARKWKCSLRPLMRMLTDIVVWKRDEDHRASFPNRNQNIEDLNFREHLRMPRIGVFPFDHFSRIATPCQARTRFGWWQEPAALQKVEKVLFRRPPILDRRKKESGRSGQAQL